MFNFITNFYNQNNIQLLFNDEIFPKKFENQANEILKNEKKWEEFYNKNIKQKYEEENEETNFQRNLFSHFQREYTNHLVNKSMFGNDEDHGIFQTYEYEIEKIVKEKKEMNGTLNNNLLDLESDINTPKYTRYDEIVDKIYFKNTRDEREARKSYLTQQKQLQKAQALSNIPTITTLLNFDILGKVIDLPYVSDPQVLFIGYDFANDNNFILQKFEEFCEKLILEKPIKLNSTVIHYNSVEPLAVTFFANKGREFIEKFISTMKMFVDKSSSNPAYIDYWKLAKYCLTNIGSSISDLQRYFSENKR
ncbi:hypothetical protein M0811_04398 [Anaeramoeba ignava]|uniref:Uncharacterized protein n=1 Tax=Anaeramoeba ignava TaxID=1746090 RepID=A0A9Q0RGM5_ANAIG|nr:hypothetical protein M0811_04398 [Anaeramoeba ignava]